MLFITNRFPRQSIKTRIHRNFDFDLANNAASHSVFFCERLGHDVYEEIGSRRFLKRLKETRHRQLLFYLHGFSCLPEDVFAAVAEFQALCDASEPGEVLAVPLIWPCDNDLGVVKDYWDDQLSASLSGYAFARLLQRFLSWREAGQLEETADPFVKPLNLLAHSMGNRVLRESLEVWRKHYLPGGVPLLFCNTFLIAADIVNVSLDVGASGEPICQASRNVSVYFASSDLSLLASRAANLRQHVASRRLGHSGPADMRRVPYNVYSVDCDDVSRRYDPRHGHSYFRSGERAGEPGAVFLHLFEALRAGRVLPEEPRRRLTILRAQ